MLHDVISVELDVWYAKVSVLPVINFILTKVENENCWMWMDLNEHNKSYSSLLPREAYVQVYAALKNKNKNC